MRDIKRINRILNKIRIIWVRFSDQRLLQLCINNGIIPDTFDSWSIEDDKLEKHLDKIINGKNDI